MSEPTEESIYAYVMEQLEQTKGTWPTVARESGVNFRTLEKIGRRETEDPRVSHVEKLARYFRAKALLATPQPSELRV